MKDVRKFYENKNILVIGAASGIGEAIVRQLARYTTSLYLTARSRKKLEGIYGKETEFTYLELDLARIDELGKTFMKIKREARIDIVINLAGYDVFKRFDTLSDEDIRNDCYTNFEGTVYLIRKVLRTFFNDGHGVLVNINAYVGGRLSMPYFSINAASRAAVANLFRSLRREYAMTDIRFVIFSPSGVGTETEKGERGHIWERNKIKLEKPEIVAEKFLVKLSRGKNEITLAGAGERFLAFLDNYFPGLADILFFKSFFTITSKMVNK